MLALTLAGLRANATRTVATAVAIVVAVAFLVGTLVLRDTMDRSLATVTAEQDRAVAVAVRSATAVSAGAIDVDRPRIPQSLVSEVQAVPGVTAASGTIRTTAQVVGPDGAMAGSGPARPLGLSWIDEPGVRSWTLVEGRAPTGPDEIVIDSVTAAATGYRPGDVVPIVARGGRRDYTLVGTASPGAISGRLGSSVVFWDLATAQAVAGAEGTVDSIVAAGAGSEDQLRDAVAHALDDQAHRDQAVEVLTGDELRRDQGSVLGAGLGFVDQLLVVFAGISLLIAALLIANTFSMLVAQRLRELALLRALGARSSQVMVAVIGEALAVGTVASVVGVGVGLAVATGLTRLFARLGIDVGTGLVVTGPTVIGGLVVGTVVTLAAALLPARRAARTPPIAALRQSALPDLGASSRWRLGAGIVVGLAGAATVVVALTSGSSGAFAPVAVGAVAVLVAAQALAPFVAGPASRLLGGRPAALVLVVAVGGFAAWAGWSVWETEPPLVGVLVVLALVGGGALVVRTALAAGTPTGRIGRGNSARNPRRTAATASTLMLGLGIVTAVAVLAASTRGSLDDLITTSYRADFVLTARFPLGVSPDLAASISELPDVAAVSGKRFGQAEIDGAGVIVGSLDPAAIEALFDLGDDGASAGLGTDGVAVARTVADQEGIRVGDQLVVSFAESGPQTLRVVALFEDGAIGPRIDYLVSTATFEQFEAADRQTDLQVLVRARPGVPLETLQAELVTAASAYPQVLVEGRDAFRSGRAALVDRFVNLVYALLVLSVLIAALGITNTLGLSVVERRREIGLLRAVGMSAAQLRAAIRWEALIIAVLGATTGAVLGLVLGSALVASLRTQGLRVLAVPFGTAAVVAALGVALGVVAAALPAWRASRLAILDAIGEP